jgi:ADP-ribose/FAD diphosphatase
VPHCRRCGAATARRVPDDDDRERDVCPACGEVHYRNPRMIVGCLVEAGDEVLLCRRAIEPARGRWTFPAGYLELGEGAVAGAVRETREEAGCEVEVLSPLAHLDLVHIGQVYAVWRARLVGGFSAGEESLEVAMFAPDAIPWDELAFPSVRCALELWAADRRDGAARLHQGVLRYRGRGDRLALASYELVELLSVALDPTR